MTHKNGPGCPIRTSKNHSLVTSSSWLIAGSHVLHRLLTPRHPPCALDRLTMPTSHLLTRRSPAASHLSAITRSCPPAHSAEVGSSSRSDLYAFLSFLRVLALARSRFSTRPTKRVGCGNHIPIQLPKSPAANITSKGSSGRRRLPTKPVNRSTSLATKRSRCQKRNGRVY